MLVQPLPSAAQRNHWSANESTGAFHAPFVTESVLPTATTPETLGGLVATSSGAIAAVVADAVGAEAPAAFADGSSARNTKPGSAGTSRYVAAVAPPIFDPVDH